MIPVIGWWAILGGPTAPTAARHLLADHLTYLRKTGGPPPAEPEVLPPEEEALLEGGEEPGAPEDGIAPDLADRFAAHRDRLFHHTQGGPRLADEELGRAVDELEALVEAVSERARELDVRLRRGDAG